MLLEFLVRLSMDVVILYQVCVIITLLGVQEILYVLNSLQLLVGDNVIEFLNPVMQYLQVDRVILFVAHLPTVL